MISYNGGKKEINVGDTILIPNLYQTVDTTNNTVSYSYAVARGIDISSYQTNINWNRVAETSDYVIVQVARDPSDYVNTKGDFKDVCVKQIQEVVNRDISLGLYFCVSKDMKVSVYEERLENYLTRFDREMSENRIELNKDNIPVFLDFEVYFKGNDYYRLMESFERICNEHGFTKIGIYGNKNTLDQISASMKKDGEHIDLKNTDWYVWKSGGPQYSANEQSHEDDVTLAELEEIQCKSTNKYTPVMQQVTNVCTDTGATNDMDHCDVSFLYDASVFGDDLVDSVDSIESSNDYVETVEIDLNNYPNLPISTIASCVDSLLSIAFIITGIKVVGKKLMISLKNKNTEKKLVK